MNKVYVVTNCYPNILSEPKERHCLPFIWEITGYSALIFLVTINISYINEVNAYLF